MTWAAAAVLAAAYGALVAHATRRRPSRPPRGRPPAPHVVRFRRPYDWQREPRGE